jgi:hypothetical protein
VEFAEVARGLHVSGGFEDSLRRLATTTLVAIGGCESASINLLGETEQDPKVDGRDLLRGLQVLLADGLIKRSSPLTSARLERIAASQGGMFLTDAGLWWLTIRE